MKTVELPGIKVDPGLVWYDLLKKGFDVEAVGVNDDGTFVYVADDEQRNPQPIIEGLVGKTSPQMSRFEIERRQKTIKDLLAAAKKRRAEKAATLAAEEAERLERRNMGYPELRVSSAGHAGMFGVVEALSNGVDTFTVLIEKADPTGTVMDGSEELSVTTSHKVAISDAAPKLSEGMAMIKVGPSTAVGDFMLEVKDGSGNMKPVKLLLRFVRQRSGQGNDPEPPPPILEKNGGLMAVIRRILGI